MQSQWCDFIRFLFAFVFPGASARNLKYARFPFDVLL